MKLTDSHQVSRDPLTSFSGRFIVDTCSYVDRPTALQEGLAFWTQDGIPGIQVSSYTLFCPSLLYAVRVRHLERTDVMRR